jgi:hypothetical protein
MTSVTSPTASSPSPIVLHPVLSMVAVKTMIMRSFVISLAIPKAAGTLRAAS